VDKRNNRTKESITSSQKAISKSSKIGSAEEGSQTFKGSRKSIRLAIKRSQETCWRNLCAEVDHDPWGTPYRTVMNKIGKRPAVPENMVPLIVSELFPIHPAMEGNAQQATATIPPVTLQKMEMASTKLYPGKATGPDGVPNETLKVAVNTHPPMFQEAYSQRMKDGVFLQQWKKARLVLPRRGDKPVD